MKLYLSDQTKNFSQHLEFLKSQKVKRYDRDKLTEKITTIPLDTTKSLHELPTDILFDYKIFPDNIMSYLAQWAFEKRQIQIGDTIVQQAYLPPFRNLSQKIIFGVRINDIINEPERIGFSYQTLEGTHRERNFHLYN